MSKDEPNLRDSVIQAKKIADAVVHVSKAIKDLENGPLNQKALLVLLSHSSGLSQANIKKVLAGLSTLEEMYVKPREEKI